MNSKTCSIIALVCGIIGVVFAWWGMVISIIAFICAIVGIVFGAMGMKKAKAENAPKGLAVAGLVCGIVGAALALIGVICAACVLCTASAIYDGAANGSLSSSLNELSSLLS